MCDVSKRLPKKFKKERKKVNQSKPVNLSLSQKVKTSEFSPHLTEGAQTLSLGECGRDFLETKAGEGNIRHLLAKKPDQGQATTAPMVERCYSIPPSPTAHCCCLNSSAALQLCPIFPKISLPRKWQPEWCPPHSRGDKRQVLCGQVRMILVHQNTTAYIKDCLDPK